MVLSIETEFPDGLSQGVTGIRRTFAPGRSSNELYQVLLLNSTLCSVVFKVSIFVETKMRSAPLVSEILIMPSNAMDVAASLGKIPFFGSLKITSHPSPIQYCDDLPCCS